MKSLAARGVLCVLALLGIIVATGCSYAFSKERNEFRMRVMKLELKLLVDDIDWILGFDESSMLLDEANSSDMGR